MSLTDGVIGHEIHSIQKILVIQLRQLGDVLMTTPVVRQLRERFPHAQIDFLTEEVGRRVYECNPHIHKVILLKRKATFFENIMLLKQIYNQKYDLVVDCFCNPRSAIITFFSRAKIRVGYNFKGRMYAYNHIVDGIGKNEYSAITKLRLVEKFGANLNDFKIEYFAPESANTFANDFFKKHGLPQKTILFNVVSRREYKIWDSSNFIALGNWLIEKGFFLLFAPYGAKEYELAKKVYDGLEKKQNAYLKTEELNLHEMYGVVQKCCGYIGNDGGMKHLAVCAGIPTFTIFQNINWINWTPPNSLLDDCISNCLEDEDVCKGCRKTGKCFVHVSAEQVIEKISQSPLFRL